MLLRHLKLRLTPGVDLSMCESKLLLLLYVKCRVKIRRCISLSSHPVVMSCAQKKHLSYFGRAFSPSTGGGARVKFLTHKRFVLQMKLIKNIAN